MPKEDNLMGPVEAAKYLGVHVGTLANWRYYGKGPKYTSKGHRILYDQAVLKKFKERESGGALQ